MTLNWFSIVMSIVLFTVISTICCLFLTHTKSTHLWIVALILGLSLLRCVIPVEIIGSYIVNCWEIYPELYKFIQHQIWGTVSIGNAFCMIWLTGSTIFLLRLFIEILRQLRLGKTVKQSPADSRIHRLAQHAADDISCKQAIRVHITSRFSSPVMIGFFHPIILIPESTANMEDHEITHILRHEISHYKGGDVWFRLVIQMFVCLLWWNPTVYLLRRSVIQLLELRCDDRACQTLTDDERMEYSSVLVKLLKTTLKHRNELLAAGFIGYYYRSFICQRIQMLLSPPPTKPAIWKTFVTVSVCVFLYLSSYSVIFQPAFEPPMDQGFVYPTAENAWLVPLADGRYEFWVDGVHFSTLSGASVTAPPFDQFPVYEKEDLP